MASSISSPNFAHLLPPSWRRLIQTWLDEDIPSTDVGGFVVGESEQTAVLYGKSPGVLAGQCFVEEVFKQMGCSVEWELPEGAIIDLASVADDRVVVGRVRGSCRHILIGERTALNILSRCSGVATLARAATDIALAAGWAGMVAGTRKTTPGFRLVEKYALIVGGAATHRNDLSEMVMLKDNHIAAAGSIPAAVALARRAAGFSMKIEVETSNYEDAVAAAGAGADIVMLDNFAPLELKEVARQLKATFPNVLIEASGGITTETMHEYFDPAVDIVSRGSLTQGYPCLDFSLKIVIADK
ncbi:unnamed protein product [Phaeothamnion confervicola]